MRCSCRSTCQYYSIPGRVVPVIIGIIIVIIVASTSINPYSIIVESYSTARFLSSSRVIRTTAGGGGCRSDDSTSRSCWFNTRHVRNTPQPIIGYSSSLPSSSSSSSSSLLYSKWGIRRRVERSNSNKSRKTTTTTTTLTPSTLFQSTSNNINNDDDNNNSINNSNSNPPPPNSTPSSYLNTLSTTTTLKPSPPPSPGRLGYNQTLLHICHYDTIQYYEAYQTSHWGIRLGLIKDYARYNGGDVNVPIGYRVDDVEDYGVDGMVKGVYTIYLGRWLNRVRRLYRDTNTSGTSTTTTTTTNTRSLPTVYVNELTTLGINWAGVGIGRRPASYRRRVTELREFRATYGHVNVPRDWTMNRSLGIWVERQRVSYRRWVGGRRSDLDEERVDILRELGVFDGAGAGIERKIDGSVGSDNGVGNVDRGNADIERRRVELEDWNGTIEHFMEGGVGAGVGGGRGDFVGSIEDVGGSTALEQQQIDDGGADTDVASAGGVGIIVDMKERFERQWWKSLQSLELYKGVYGHCNVPLEYQQGDEQDMQQDFHYDDERDEDEDDDDRTSLPSLGYWVIEQRRQYATLLEPRQQQQQQNGTGGGISTAALRRGTSSDSRGGGRTSTSVLPLSNSKSTLTPTRMQALTNLDFDFQFNNEKEKEEGSSNYRFPLPWEDVGMMWILSTSSSSITNANDKTRDQIMSPSQGRWQQQQQQQQQQKLEEYYAKTGRRSLTVGSALAYDYEYDYDGSAENDGNGDGGAMSLYCFLKKLRWENQHRATLQFVTATTTTTSNDTDETEEEGRNNLQEQQQQIILNDNTINDDNNNSIIHASTTLQNEYDWWEHYHDLRRYHAVNGEFHITADDTDGSTSSSDGDSNNNNGIKLWYSDSLRRWTQDQDNAYAAMMMMVTVGGVYNGSPNSASANYREDGASTLSSSSRKRMTEWHYRALCDIGYTFGYGNDEDDGNAIKQRILQDGSSSSSSVVGPPARVGRRPSVVSLELDTIVVDEKDNGNDDNNSKTDVDNFNNDTLQQREVVVDGRAALMRLKTAEGREKAEDVAWLLQYEAMMTNGVSVIKDEHHMDDTDDADNDGDSGASRQERQRRRLALWATNQRKQYAKYLTGQTSNLTSRRIRLLNEIDFDWKLPEEVRGEEGGKHHREKGWDAMVSELRSFKEEYGHCFIPADYFPNRRLGRWVHRQRASRRQSRVNNGANDSTNGVVEDESKANELQLLQKIGLDLTMDNFSFAQKSFDTLWNARFEELRRYREDHGGCSDVRLDYASPYYDLALWVKEQRLLYHRATLDGIPSQLNRRRIGELEKIGFLWEQQQRW